jgi:hypothetical protein
MNIDTTTTGRGARHNPAKEKFWRRVLREFAGSKQSVREFCQTRQLSEPSFYAWRSSLARRDADRSKAARTAATVPAFLPIRLADAGNAPGDVPFEIVLASGHRIRLRPPVDRAALTEIVTALQLVRIATEPAEASPSAAEASPWATEA